MGNRNIVHDTELWNSSYYLLSVSDYTRHLEADAKVLSSSLEYLAYFKKCSFEGHSIEQFPTILGVSSYVWNLFQTISENGLDCFKISSQSNTSTLVEAIRTVYGPNPILTSSPNVEMAVDVLEAEKVILTLITTNKKHKEKNKAPFFLSVFSTISRSKISLVLQPSSYPKVVTSHPVSKSVTTYSGSTVTPSSAIIISKTVKLQTVSLLVLLALRT